MCMAQRPRRPICTSELSGCQYLLEFLNGHPDRLFDTIRMDIVAFRALYRWLTEMEVLDHDKLISTEEVVVMFL